MCISAPYMAHDFHGSLPGTSQLFFVVLVSRRIVNIYSSKSNSISKTAWAPSCRIFLFRERTIAQSEDSFWFSSSTCERILD